MPGGQCTRSLACEINKAHERSHHRYTGVDPAFPAQWFYGLLRDLPGDQACLTPSPALLLADLTPASGRQNHTTSPYASTSFVRLAFARALTLPRPSHPAPNVRDDREAPLLWARDGGSPSADLPDGKSGIFLIPGLARFRKIRSDLPVGSICRSPMPGFDLPWRANEIYPGRQICGWKNYFRFLG